MLYIHDIIREAASRRGHVTSKNTPNGKVDATNDFREAWDTFNRYITAHFMKFRGVSLVTFLKIGWVADGGNKGAWKPYFQISDSFAAQNSIEHSLARPPQSDLCRFSELNWIKASLKFSNDQSKDNFKSILTDIINVIGEHARVNHSMTIDFEIGKLYFQDRRVRFSFASRVLNNPALQQESANKGIGFSGSASTVSGMTGVNRSQVNGGLIYNPSASFDIPDDALTTLTGMQSNVSRMSRANKSTVSQGGLFAAAGIAHPKYNPGNSMARDPETASTLTAANLERLNAVSAAASASMGVPQVIPKSPSVVGGGNNEAIANFLAKQQAAITAEMEKQATADYDKVNLNEAERDSPFLVSEIRRLRNEAANANLASAEVKDRLEKLADAAEQLLRKKKKVGSMAIPAQGVSTIGLEPKRDVMTVQGDAALLNYFDDKAQNAATLGAPAGPWNGIKSAAEEALDRYLTYLEVRAAQSLRERELFERGIERGLEEEREEHRLKQEMTKQYKEYLDSQAKYDAEMKQKRREEFINAASSHEFPVMSEAAPDVLKKEMWDKHSRLRDDLSRQIELNKAVKERDRALTILHEAQVAALTQVELGNQDRLTQMQKQQEKIELISAWERDLRMKNLLKSIEGHMNRPQLVPLNLGGESPSRSAVGISGSYHNPISAAQAEQLYAKSQENYNTLYRLADEHRPSSSGGGSVLSVNSGTNRAVSHNDIFAAAKHMSPTNNAGSSSLLRSASQAVLGGSARPGTSIGLENFGGKKGGSVVSVGSRVVPSGASMSLEQRRALLQKSRTTTKL